MHSNDLAKPTGWGDGQIVRRPYYVAGDRESLIKMLRDDPNWQNLVKLSWSKPQYHEPDELSLTAVLKGRSFDNAMMDDSEKYIELRQDNLPVARLNLACLLALAAAALDQEVR